MTRFSPIRIDRLPFPNVIVPVDFEAILAEFKDKLPVYIEDDDLRAEIAGILAAPLEGEPLVALLQTFAYFYMTKVGEENDKAKALMLPYSTGRDLEVLAYNLYGTSKLEGESDDALRERAMLSWEALSTAGPYGAYTFHALSAHPRVKGVNVLGPESGEALPGQVKIVVLSKDGNGTASPSMVSAVLSYLNAEDRRPLTDQVLVVAAVPLTYAVQAVIYVSPGPDHEIIKAAVRDRLAAFVGDRQKIGGIVPLSGLHAALTVEGVERVSLVTPTEDLEATELQAPFCTGFLIDVVEVE